MGPLLAAGLAKGFGTALSGASKSREAKKQLKRVEKYSDDAIQAAYDDQATAIRLRESDEARLKDGTGYDLVKLREDAVKAGFNPLTVLNATGGAGYDGRGAVLTTPFVSIADVKMNKANLVAGAGNARIDTAGYIGDAISAGSSAYFAQRGEELDRMMERDRIAAIKGEASSGSYGVSSFGGLARSVDASHTVVAGSPFAGWGIRPGEMDTFSYSDRPTQKTPLEDVAAIKVVTFPDGIKVRTINTDVFESEPGEIINDIGSAGGWFAQTMQPVAKMWGDQAHASAKAIDRHLLNFDLAARSWFDSWESAASRNAREAKSKR